MSTIDEVKSRIDIADLIGESVTLQRAGRNFRALCPFHSERTPSFHVSPERQTWHCFGACGEGGDIFSYVMKRQDLEFGEALRLLADRAGVALSDRRDPQEDERKKRLFEANEAAAAFFHNALLHSRAGQGTRGYVSDRRLDSATVEAFQLGYSPDSWDTLKSHLTERGFTQEELLSAGLLVESDRGGYDRFRGRLMFPIRDDRSRTVGFGARALESADADDETAGAKYINTPQSPLFDKSGLLYALDLAKEAIRREKSVIVVEGYMDVIAAHQHGITNVVASMGTALTERQIRTLERFKSKILLAMDADAAGIEATLRALREAAELGAIKTGSQSAHPSDVPDEEFAARVQEWSRDALKRVAVNFSVIPLSGKDPDDMIRSDREAWDASVATAVPFYDHIFNIVIGRKDLTQPSERAGLLEELLPVVRLIQEPTQRAHYVQRLAAKARVDERVVWPELQRQPKTAARRDTVPVAEPTLAQRTRREPGEEFCLALLLRHQDLRPEGEALSPELFLLGEHRAIYAAWRETSDMASLRASLPEDLHAHLDTILARELPFYEGTQLRQALQDCVLKIEEGRLSQAKRASSHLFAEATGLGKDDEATYVEDMEQGLRLHQLGLERRRVRSQRVTPQSEGER